MFKPDAMSEVNIFLMKDNLKDVTNMLYDMKLIEFFEIEQESFSRFEHEDLNEASGELLRIRSAITILKDYFTKSTNNFSEDALEKTLETKKKLDKYEKELSIVKDEIRRERILKGLKVKKEELNSPDYIIGFLPKASVKTLKLLDKENIKYRSYKGEKRLYFIAKTSKKLPFAYKEFYLPKHMDENLAEKLNKVESSINKAKSDLGKLADSNLDHLRKEEHKLSKDIAILEARPKFSKTENIVVMNGFVPKKSVRTIRKNLDGMLSDKYEMDEKDAKDNAPIKLSNPSGVNKFESLLRMYSLPKYGEFDPTILMFFVFPVFYGFILGDVIYGLISLIVFTIIRMKKKELKDFMSILQLSSIMSIVFGIIYGEFMGYEFHGPFYGFFERSHDPQMLLFFAVLLGAIHINLGLIVGFVNNLKNIKKAVCDKLSWIIMQFGLGILALGIYAAEQTAVLVGSILFILSVILIYMGHGFIGIIEIPSFFTNILSYARLMAVGLSSVVIAILINEFTHVLFGAGVLGVIGGIVLFTLGHIFNIVLGNFESFLHTLRLHYVEFFTKFYDGGGREFVPFGTKRYEE